MEAINLSMGITSHMEVREVASITLSNSNRHGEVVATITPNNIKRHVDGMAANSSRTVANSIPMEGEEAEDTISLEVHLEALHHLEKAVKMVMLRGLVDLDQNHGNIEVDFLIYCHQYHAVCLVKIQIENKVQNI